MSDQAAALIWSTFADEESAATAASTLLDEGLVVCANFIAIGSLYRWKGERGEARECASLFKTRADLLDRATRRLGEIHPYETPAITAWRCDRAGADTLSWLGELGG